MKNKNIFIIVISIILIYNINVSAIEWNVNRNEVIFEEKDNIMLLDEDVVVCRDYKFDMEFNIFYNFEDDKLDSVFYNSYTKFDNKENYLDEYKVYKHYLTKEYGNPFFDDVVWLADEDLELILPKDMNSVSWGLCKYLTKWKTKDSIISVGLWGEDGKIKLFLNYKRRELK